MIAKRRQFSESQLKCGAMSETNKYSFETLFYVAYQPLAMNHSLLFLPLYQLRRSYLVGEGFKGKANTQQSYHCPATYSLPFRCFGRSCPEGPRVGMHMENVRVSQFDSDLNKELPRRLLGQCSTRPGCPAYPRFLISNETKK